MSDTFEDTERTKHFPQLPGVMCWRYYGIVWPAKITSNGNPWQVRRSVNHYHPELLPQFDQWVADVSGWDIGWPSQVCMWPTDWNNEATK